MFTGLNHPLALDIGETSIKWVVLDKASSKNGLHKLLSWGEEPLPGNTRTCAEITGSEKLSIFIANTLKKAKKIKSHAETGIALPESKTYIVLSTTPTQDTIAFEKDLERQIPLTLSEIIQNTISLQDIDSATHLIAATSKHTSEQFSACVEKAGYIPVTAQPQSFAVIRSLTPKVAWENPVTILHFESDHLSIIIAHNRLPLMSLTYPLPFKILDASPESIVRFIKENAGVAFRFFSMRFPKLKPDTIYLTGEAPNPKTLVVKLQQEMNMPVAIGNTLLHVAYKKDSINEEQAMRLAAAIGIALDLTS